jgi:type IV secretion system protein VirD4
MIASNCHVRVASAPNQQDTAKLVSEMTGTTTVQKATYNFSGQRLSLVMGHVNASVDNIERPLLTPDEVQRLKAPKKKGSGEKERIVAPGQMLIFVSVKAMVGVRSGLKGPLTSTFSSGFASVLSEKLVV